MVAPASNQTMQPTAMSHEAWFSSDSCPGPWLQLICVVHASEAGDNAGESPAGRIKLFATENRAIPRLRDAARRGGEWAAD
jgi:hypothetical protein